MPEPFIAPKINTALRACTLALHKLTPAERLETMDQLVRWYLPDGSYHDRIDLETMLDSSSEETPMR